MKSIKALFLSLMMGVTMSALAAERSVGIFPTSFPRDPIDVNIFLEHILLGQIIEPLVESGPDGTVVPAASSRWQFSEDGLTLKFFFNENSRFSNGQRLTADDAKYTLERHIQSPNSQSKSYLKRIVAMDVISPTELSLRFSEPYVAVLKALSRDHLGIVPRGWKFNAASAEPFTGSGAYRAVKESSGWVLIKNPHYRNAANVEIDRWNVIFSGPKGQEATAPLPDLVPFAFLDTVEQLKQNPKWSDRYAEEDITHFFQSSAWWYPLGNSPEEKLRQKLGMCAVEDLIASRTKSLELHRVTGLIPEGIAGHLAKNPPVSCKVEELSAVKNRSFKIYALTREAPIVNHEPTIRAVEQKYGIQLTIVSMEAPAMKNLASLQPDILVVAFAGGFQDPEGFLTVITAMLNTELKNVFGEDYETYLRASSEGDWQLRTPLYQKINRNLVSNMRMVPGWRVKARRVRCADIVLTANDLRYSPKLGDYKLRKEKP